MSNRIGELFGKTGGVFLGSQFQRPVLGYLSTFSGRVMELWSSPWILWGSDFRKLSWWPSRKPTPCSLYKSWQPHTIHIVKSMMASPQVTWYLCTDLHGFVDDLHSSTLLFSKEDRKMANNLPSSVSCFICWSHTILASVWAWYIHMNKTYTSQRP